LWHYTITDVAQCYC